VDGGDCFHCLGFHQEAVLDEYIESQRFFAFETFVANPNDTLVFGSQPAKAWLAKQAPFINRLIEAWTFVFELRSLPQLRPVTVCWRGGTKDAFLCCLRALL
jgi:hypothetical protein